MKIFKDFKACLRNVLSFSKEIKSESVFWVTFSSGITRGGTYIHVNVHSKDPDLFPKIIRYFYNLIKRIPWADERSVWVELDDKSVGFTANLKFRIESEFPEISHRWKTKATDRHFQYTRVKTGSSVSLEMLCLSK